MPYRQVEHTADLALEIEAEDEPALLREGARAIVELLTGEARPSPIGEMPDERELEILALDPEDRLVRWLNEILVLALVEGFLASGVELELTGETRLRARLRGRLEPDRIQNELKSVTYHDLALGRGPGPWRARVVIDV